MAVAAALQSSDRLGLLTVALGPVQPFIAAARSLRDLRTGSALLSYLSFCAMRPVIDRLGKHNLISPSLYGNPWQRSGQGEETIPTSGLPHRFLALVPWGEEGAEAATLARACEAAAKDALVEIAAAVRGKIAERMDDFRGWDALWDAQIDAMLHVRAVAVPLDVDASTLSRLGIPTDADEGGGVGWIGLVDLAGRVLAARRSVLPVPVNPAAEATGTVAKCTLLGSWEQMGDGVFWKVAPDRLRMGGVRMRPSERFCAQSLVKRFAFPAFPQITFGFEPKDVRFPDTATVAAAEWLEGAGPDLQRYADRGEWSGQWLHWVRQDQDKDEARCPDEVWAQILEAKRNSKNNPPSYYAILVADGDNMGQWLRGDKLDQGRRMSPLHHMAISEALANFSVHAAPAIVTNHKGWLIYSGGDDVLAVLPAARALSCALALRNAFRGTGGWYEGRLALGDKAGLSVGVAVVHHKEDLREALDAARTAEKKAKGDGRDRLALTVRRRSGEHATSFLRWENVPWMTALVEAFRDGASDRWAYRLRGMAGTLDGLPVDAGTAELKRQVGRSEGETLERLARLGPILDLAPAATDDDTKAMALAALAAAYERFRHGHDGPRIADFALACQDASFLARGRDR